MSQLSAPEKNLQAAVEQLTEKIKQFFSLSPRQCEAPRAITLLVEVESGSHTDLDPLAWLVAQTEATKIYWRGRHNGSDPLEAAAIGLADDIRVESAPLEYSKIMDRLTSRLDPVDCQARYWGGIGFHTNRDHPDSVARSYFPAARFILPRFELLKKDNRTTLACNFIIGDSKIDNRLPEIIQAAQALVMPAGEADQSREEVPTIIGREDTPDRRTWCDRVERCVETIREGSLEKIVLARRSIFSFTRPLDPWLLLEGFRESDNGRFLFGFQPEPDVCFVCASPELLYARSGRVLKSEALAGTRPRSNDKVRDRLLGEKLLNSNKERREHAFVENQIEAELEQLCSEALVKTDRSLVKLQHVQHLVSHFTGHLKEDITDADLLRTLHPTPAVGGHPADKAVEMILGLETFDRSWYAGPVGWVSADRAEFAVGIRSGILRENSLTLFSGAGIVDGSIPDREWDEIENKIAGFMALLSR